MFLLIVLLLTQWQTDPVGSFVDVYLRELASGKPDRERVWSSYAAEFAARLNEAKATKISKKLAESLTTQVARGLDDNKGSVAVEEVFSVAGHESACFIVPFLWDARSEVDGDMTSWSRILAYREGNQWRTQLIESGAPSIESVMIGEAALVSGVIVAIGRMHTGGNWPLIGADVFEYKDDRWQRTQQVCTPNEGAVWSRLTLTKDGDLEPVKVEMRVYPAFLNVPHMGPLVRRSATWTFDGKRWNQSKWTRRDTIVAAVDDLLVATNKGTFADVRARCTSDELARKFVEMYTVDDLIVGVVEFDPKSWDAHDDMELRLYPHYANLKFRRVNGVLKLAEISLP